MPRIASEALVHSLESVFDGQSVAGLSDRQLLERFNAARDAVAEAAFAALVARHGPMVLDLCQQILGDLHQAEDAFQAVFLVLARRAPSIREPDLLANWLYGVALRTARCAKAQLICRRKKEEADTLRRHRPGSSGLVEPMVQAAEQPVIGREQAEALHSEIARLPGSFRLPVVLCYFEGLTLDEAARRLNCPTGTLRSRLARARDKLRRGLVRRGVGLPASVLAVALSSRTAAASVSSHLCETTARAAIQFAAGRSAAPLAVAIAQAVLRSMLFHKLKLICLGLLLLGTLATSAGYISRALALNGEPKRPAASVKTPVTAKTDDAKPKPGPGRMFVVGRVLDPQGKPVAGAAVAAAARILSRRAFGAEEMDQVVIGHVDADRSGRFRLDAPRMSSSRNEAFMAVALAPGYGAGWVKIDPDADLPAADISLQPEQVIQGRLLDLQGRPAQGVVVSVSSIRREVVLDSGPQLEGRVTSDGPKYWWARVNDNPAWPKPAITDAGGRFTIHGLGRGFKTRLSIIDPRFPLEEIEVETDDSPGAKLLTRALQPAKIFTGRVTYADTGERVPHARLEVLASAAGQGGNRPTYFHTDADGRFRVNPSPGERFTIYALPPAGQLYIGVSKGVDWPKGAVEQSIDLALSRGVAIRGTVVEEGSGQPIAGALVNFRSYSPPAGTNPAGSFAQSVTADDGSFAFAVAPRAGHLVVLASNEDYVLREFGSRELSAGQPGGTRLYSHSFVACEPQPGGPDLKVTVALRRGVTVLGRIIGPDEQLVRDVWIIGRMVLEPGPTALRNWRGHYHREAPTGRFELHGLDPDTTLPVYFLQPNRRLGATVHLSGKSAAGGPLTIRLEPCGTATARLVDARGGPIAGYHDANMISMIIAPSPDPASRLPADAKGLSGQAGRLFAIDPINYAKEPTSDADGRITFPALIPGAIYRIAIRARNARPFRKDLTVKPGETIDLGDLLIEKGL